MHPLRSLEENKNKVISVHNMSLRKQFIDRTSTVTDRHFISRSSMMYSFTSFTCNFFSIIEHRVISALPITSNMKTNKTDWIPRWDRTRDSRLSRQCSAQPQNRNLLTVR